MQRKWTRHLLGAALAALVGFGIAVVYILMVPKEGLEGWSGIGLTLSLFVFPVVGLGFTVCIWIPLGLWWQRRTGRLPYSVALGVGIGFGLVFAMLFGGPSGFSMRGGTPLINVALMVVCTGGALAHTWAYRRRQDRRRDPAGPRTVGER